MRNTFSIKCSPTKLAIADLCDYYGHGMIITRINVPKEFRGTGKARYLLSEICKAADETNTNLWLEIAPSDGLQYEELERWYMRNGFRRYRGAMIYCRKPISQEWRYHV